jgi:hypothetical protein
MIATGFEVSCFCRLLLYVIIHCIWLAARVVTGSSSGASLLFPPAVGVVWTKLTTHTLLTEVLELF